MQCIKILDARTFLYRTQHTHTMYSINNNIITQHTLHKLIMKIIYVVVDAVLVVNNISLSIR